MGVEYIIANAAQQIAKSALKRNLHNIKSVGEGVSTIARKG
jgi:hypothetical protein